MKKIATLLGIMSAAVLLVPTAALANGSGGVTGAAFYVDGDLYRTVLTPTDLSNTGAPDHTFDTIYGIGHGNRNVATAAPGDEGYNGGRWRVEVVDFGDLGFDAALDMYDANDSGDFDTAAEVEAALANIYVSTSAGPSFVCPVIPLPNN